MKKDEKSAILSVSARTEPRENDSEAGVSSTDPAISDGAVTVGAGNARIHCLTVIGQIEGHYQLGGLKFPTFSTSS